MWLIAVNLLSSIVVCVFFSSFVYTDSAETRLCVHAFCTHTNFTHFEKWQNNPSTQFNYNFHFVYKTAYMVSLIYLVHMCTASQISLVGFSWTSSTLLFVLSLATKIKNCIDPHKYKVEYPIALGKRANKICMMFLFKLHIEFLKAIRHSHEKKTSTYNNNNKHLITKYEGDTAQKVNECKKEDKRKKKTKKKTPWNNME